MDKQQLLFNAWVTSVNTSLGRYIARLMTEADPRSTTEFTTALAQVEQDLADELLELAHVLFQKSADRPYTVPNSSHQPVQPPPTRPAIPEM